MSFQMMNTSREWNIPAVMTAKKLLMKNYFAKLGKISTHAKWKLVFADCMFIVAS
jgi:hypothetical protein